MYLPKNLTTKAVIFDLDGVLLNSMHAHVAAWESALAEIDLTVDRQILYLNEGNLDWSMLTMTWELQGCELNAASFESIMFRQREIYNDRHRDRVGLYPGAVKLVEHLTETGLPLALVTSSTRQVLKPELVAWLDQYFSLIITGDQVVRNKPHPEPYLKALFGLDLGPEQALVVENAPAGIKAARAAGMTCLALATTLPSSALDLADRVFPDHEALAAWLNAHLE